MSRSSVLNLQWAACRPTSSRENNKLRFSNRKMRGLEDDDAGATMADIESYLQNHKAERRPQGLRLKIRAALWPS